MKVFEEISDVLPTDAHQIVLCIQQQAAAELTKYPEHFPGADDVRGLIEFPE